MTTLRTSIAVIGALMMLVAPAATAADKPDDEHRYFATDAPASASSRQYGLPRAMPSHYDHAGIELVRQTGSPRTMPADYAAAGIALAAQRVSVADLRSPDVRDAVHGRYPSVASVVVAASSPGFDWFDAGLGAMAAAALMLAMIASWLLMLRRRRETRVGPSVVQH
jgi:hypothetical protein